jgi:hypothetical protein
MDLSGPTIMDLRMDRHLHIRGLRLRILEDPDFQAADRSSCIFAVDSLLFQSHRIHTCIKNK